MIINYDVNNKGGGASAEGCLRYDEAQDLTTEQQAQAKENLGIEEPEPLIYEVSGLAEIPAETANLIHADYMSGKTVLVKITQSAAPTRSYSVVSAKTENTYNYFTLSDKNNLYELKSNKLSSQGELATLTTTAIQQPSVLYTEQTLTDAQKQQARTNIGAAKHKVVEISSSHFPDNLTEADFIAMLSAYSYNSGPSPVCVKIVDPSFNEDRTYVILCVQIDPSRRSVALIDVDYKGVYDITQAPSIHCFMMEGYSSMVKHSVYSLYDFLTDAPSDNKQYARCNGQWAEVEAGGGEAVQSDWNETDTDDPAFIKNKPTIPTVNNPTVTIKQGGTTKGTFTLNQGSAATIDLEAGGGEAVQSDWLETDTDDPAFIKNKPYIPQAEYHYLYKAALSEPMGCQAETWQTLCQLILPKSGAWQVSASARMLPADQSTAYKTATVCIELGTDDFGYTEAMEIQLPRSGEYGTMSVPVFATQGQKLRLRAISDANFYAQASPSVGKASATFIAAVYIGRWNPEPE